jgi:hypothetical protein
MQHAIDKETVYVPRAWAMQCTSSRSNPTGTYHPLIPGPIYKYNPIPNQTHFDQDLIDFSVYS